MRGKHIELFLVDGEPGGITTANVSGWTGHVLVGPRKDLQRLLSRPDAQTNGVYFLLGDDPDAIKSTLCYIGRTEDFSHRFSDHQRKKDWWNRAVLISSREDSFNEGHWGYLEARLLEIATKAERCTLCDNKQSPQPRKLSEAQESDAETFLDQVRGVLPVLGVNVLRTTDTSGEVFTPTAPRESPIFTLVNRRNGVDARARVVGDEFVMLKDSHVVGSWTRPGGSEQTRRSYASYKAQHDKLVADGSIVVDGKTGIVARDIPFSSPSTAGAIACGRSCNGRTSWTWEGGTYADWENRGIDDIDADWAGAEQDGLVENGSSDESSMSAEAEGRGNE
ncbi:MAG: GIY-YIG nuclease family protein [Actinomycetaceae bacterium]|nr:GIY-YIG nuclease family protein [Actinomycetaceae bacterium]